MICVRMHVSIIYTDIRTARACYDERVRPLQYGPKSSGQCIERWDGHHEAVVRLPRDPLQVSGLRALYKALGFGGFRV